MIENLETQQEVFKNQTETARKEYEKEVDELKHAFDNATAEEKEKRQNMDQLSKIFDVIGTPSSDENIEDWI